MAKWHCLTSIMIILVLQTYEQQTIITHQYSEALFHDPCMNVEIGKGAKRASHHERY